MPTSQIASERGRAQSLWKSAGFVIAGAVLLAASSHIEVPFYPVPMTLQTMVVLALGLGLGLHRGVSAVLLFLAAGFAGLPVFAGGHAGPAVFLGPTGGYLIGFILAAGICGWMRDRGYTKNIYASVAVALFAGAFIYVPGLLQLGTVIGWDKPVLALGLYPFILGDIVKALVAASRHCRHRPFAARLRS